MKHLLFIIMLFSFISCEQNEQSYSYDFSGKIMVGFDDYTSSLSGSTTQYYIGYKFLSTTTAIEFKADYTPPVIILSDTIVKEKFNISKTNSNYSIKNNNIILNNYSGEILSNDWFNITSTKNKIYIYTLDQNDKIGKLILKNL